LAYAFSSFPFSFHFCYFKILIFSYYF
jgi:hypothetical protein